MTALRAEFIDSIETVSPVQWNQLSGVDNPFIRYEFLHALETTGCVAEATGWRPQHILIRDAHDALVGAAPCYLKTHSYGEYVFDWAWADAYHRHGLEYYPKLLTAIPFTPSVGPRLLVSANTERERVSLAISHAMGERMHQTGASSWHLLFPDEATRKSLSEDKSLLLRHGTQFHWLNEGYASFDDFLQALASRKRKNIRKERQAVLSQGIVFKVIEGPDVGESELEAFYDFYQLTYLKRGQRPYLSYAFFQRLIAVMPEQVFLILAQREQRYVAGALFLKNQSTLFGRYWGCTEEFNHLHFETCYYQGIDYCIAHNLLRFDAGAQGEHKLLRGFRPTPTYSLHRIEHPAFRQAIANFLDEEREGVSEYVRDANAHLPFKQAE
ncbi:GNAT family N-acetyltransferase [Hahella sp. CR1]|uniref:GNAT family N-acetyltransferase n=1 Tax=Hahella sp. CR1 TaxID=2992807 RepID=UPI0024422EF6|nr:GNAT family N-acetyltransferase [Hahella sp. CR1]MDG9666161.1 GNAT family N-acetyltransferase [Hahella sp. CR1]